MDAYTPVQAAGTLPERLKLDTRAFDGPVEATETLMGLETGSGGAWRDASPLLCCPATMVLGPVRLHHSRPVPWPGAIRSGQDGGIEAR